MNVLILGINTFMSIGLVYFISKNGGVSKSMLTLNETIIDVNKG